MNHWIYFFCGILLGWFFSPWMTLIYRKIKFIFYMRKAMKNWAAIMGQEKKQ
jgi:hypothetical protein